MTQVFLAGMAVVDFVFSVDQLPDKAEKHCASDAQIMGGGCAANAAVAVARLGGKATLAACLGDDSLGDLILSDLKREGVETAFIQRAENGRSSFSSVFVDRNGERQIMNFRGAGLTPHDVLSALEFHADAVLVDTRWTEWALAALTQAKALSIPGVLDAEVPIEMSLLNAASHIAFSRQGLLSLTDAKTLPQALTEVTSELKSWACVTDGHAGVFYTDNGQIAHIPAFQVPVTDTLGAGDIWHGAFTLALGERMDAPKAIEFANAAAALKCMQFGGRKGCPDRQMTETFMKENTPCN
ncbi:MAG: PfkB family carbohydrate kinase [Paracoccaceae bacterium]|nr:PfkB family carbohydrate kinase [Paracoccaceae bacterium]